MRVYIDKENIQSFVRQNNDNLFGAVKTFFQQEADLFLNFKKEDVKPKSELEVFMRFFQECNVRSDQKIKWGSIYPSRPLQTDCIKSMTPLQLRALYLLNDKNVDDVKDQGALLIGNVGDEIKTMQKMFLMQNKLACHLVWGIGAKEMFSSWAALSKVALPLTDLIITDQFMFTDTALRNQHALFKTNILPMLSVFLRNVRFRCNIVFYARYTDATNYFLNSSTERKNVIDLVKKQVLKITKGFEPNVTIVLNTNTKHCKTDIKPREVFTNYMKRNSILRQQQSTIRDVFTKINGET